MFLVAAAQTQVNVAYPVAVAALIVALIALVVAWRALCLARVKRVDDEPIEHFQPREHPDHWKDKVL
jgi:hypothetical protein